MSGVTELTVREGGGDADRNGYWIVLGPHPETEMYAIVERSRITLPGQDPYVAYMWYLHQRAREYNSGSYMRTIKHGECATLEDAVGHLGATWPSWEPELPPEELTEQLQRLWPRSDA
jgi:hypothetical protein